ncbi:hypothetical protein AYI70_g28 [Smittium culicis]|uniref:SCAN domain-containing protein 3 n=1 Tax=Smittium culicis TaxID=133412 RepID=A0A1R1YI60_9FUNG|nr:hypothetical protein AYI70_g28 [Smittium culicis]
MRGNRKGFITLMLQENTDVVTTHCMIHREALAGKSLPENLQAALNQAVKVFGDQSIWKNEKTNLKTEEEEQLIDIRNDKLNRLVFPEKGLDESTKKCVLVCQQWILVST